MEKYLNRANINIEFSEDASSDIDQIIEYISRDSYAIARKFVIKLINYIYTLSMFHEIGTIVLKQSNIKKLIYHKYIIIYQINYNSNSINIIKIFNSKQNINIILKRIIKYIVK